MRELKPAPDPEECAAKAVAILGDISSVPGGNDAVACVIAEAQVWATLSTRPYHTPLSPLVAGMGTGLEAPPAYDDDDRP